MIWKMRSGARRLPSRWRALAALLVLASLAGATASPAAAQSGPQRQQVSGPQTHGQTALTLPGQLATARLVSLTDFESHASGLGYSYTYAGARGAIIDIYVYNSRSAVPDGAANPVVTAEAEKALGDIQTLVQRGVYADFNRPVRVSDCAYGPVNFACATVDFRHNQSDRRLGSIVAVRGLRGHFIKLRVSWPFDDQAAAEEGRAVLQAFAAHLAAQR